MREYQINSAQRFAESRNEVFAFFADAANLSRLTPEWLRFEIQSEQPIEMKRGALIDYRIRLHGFPMKWRSEISAWEPPFRFVDEQRIGPYKYWIHEHVFEEIDGHTVVSDRIRYDVPGGPIVQRLFVARDLKRIFNYRREVLGSIFSEVDSELFVAAR